MSRASSVMVSHIDECRDGVKVTDHLTHRLYLCCPVSRMDAAGLPTPDDSHLLLQRPLSVQGRYTTGTYNLCTEKWHFRHGMRGGYLYASRRNLSYSRWLGAFTASPTFATTSERGSERVDTGQNNRA
ncbi:hypothetical protein CERSUDRAFT_89746 [Gelatoporia subvermispora B]|uniref:Uncharacterized protein n=1 Tax=Ceriporiopsis subvermispora (strain B) TaxID=914234 RepID=M2P5N9_CERS8|nr:hypothetical protein CERSUDRAFT_89746 [Gelatoporia subvermispora B]